MANWPVPIECRLMAFESSKSVDATAKRGAYATNIMLGLAREWEGVVQVPCVLVAYMEATLYFGPAVGSVLLKDG